MKTTFKIPEGMTSVTIEQVGSQIITTFESYLKFNKGDFVAGVDKFGAKWVAIIKKQKAITEFDDFIAFAVGSKTIYYYGYLPLVSVNIPTEAEKQALLDAMHAQDKDWDAEKCEVVDYVWKPKRGENFWYIYGKMAYPSSNECENVRDTLVKLGNYFKTKELAEDAVQAEIKFRKTLKRY